MNRSGGNPSSACGRRVASNTSTKTRAATAVTANTNAVPICAISTPANAGPTARAPFTATPPSEATMRTCSRGTSSCTTTW